MKNERQRPSFREQPNESGEGWPQDEDLHDWMHEWRGGWHGHRAGMRMHMRMHAKQARWHARRAAWLRQHQHMDWHWRYRLKARLRHSLGARLMLVFLFLAALAGGSVYLAMSHAMGWLWGLLGLPVLTLMAYASVRHMLSPLRALVGELLALRFGEAVQQGLLRAELADDLPSRIELDRPRMQVLIGNLVDNALRHHDAGQGQPVLLSVSMVAEAESGGQSCWRLRVRDWGPGVAEDELSKLGQPFYRPDAARTRHEGGVGLGLNLCHLIVAAHGGTMQMRNAGPGLEASVTLPLNRGEA